MKLLGFWQKLSPRVGTRERGPVDDPERRERQFYEVARAEGAPQSGNDVEFLNTSAREQVSPSQQLVELPREIKLTPRRTATDIAFESTPRATSVETNYIFNQKLLGFFASLFFAFAIYVVFIHKEIYVSEAQIIVKSAAQSFVTGGNSNLAGHSLSAASTESYVVDEYIRSRDAMRKLEREVKLRSLYTVGGIDLVHKYYTFFGNSDEAFFKYYRKQVDSYVDETSGLNVLKVQAFRPDDAQLVVTKLIYIAEQFVNALNQRAIDDTLSYSNAIIARARGQLAEADAKLTAFRTVSGVVDPARESTAAQEEVTKLSTELSQLEVWIAEQTALAASSPALRAQRDRARAFRDEIDRKLKAMAGADGSIASIIGEFDRLALDKQIASQSVISAEQFRERALLDAERKHLYLQVVVPPTAPDQFAYPRRVLYLIIGFVVLILAYMMATSLQRLIEERAL